MKGFKRPFLKRYAGLGESNIIAWMPKALYYCQVSRQLDADYLGQQSTCLLNDKVDLCIRQIDRCISRHVRKHVHVFMLLNVSSEIVNFRFKAQLELSSWHKLIKWLPTLAFNLHFRTVLFPSVTGDRLCLQIYQKSSMHFQQKEKYNFNCATDYPKYNLRNISGIVPCAL